MNPITQLQLCFSELSAKIQRLQYSTVQIAAGGTGATTAVGARANLGAASIGAAVKTSTYTAVAGDALDVNTAAGAFSITLPPSPAQGDIITLYNTQNNWGTNNLTLGRNGNTIDGVAADYVLRKSYLRVQLIYSGTTWITFFSSPQVDIQIFTASGTWYKPQRAYSYEALLIGGGGGGGSGRCDVAITDRYGGGGAAGGNIVVGRGLAAFLSASESVTVAAGGTGGAARSTAGNGNSGVQGGTSIFGPYQALGGNAGSGGQITAGTAGAITSNRSGTFPSFTAATNAGGAGSNSTGVTAVGQTIIVGATGGGGGGGLNTTNLATGGGAGGSLGSVSTVISTVYAGGTAGGASGGAGSAGNATAYWVGTGGGGGGSSTAGAGGAGGAGGGYGAGGGGGGASVDTQPCGAGGNGAPGFVMVTTYCSI